MPFAKFAKFAYAVEGEEMKEVQGKRTEQLDVRRPLCLA